MFGNLFFYILGVYAFLWWFCDNFKSLFQILWSLLKSCIGENPPLNKKFGNWAGTDLTELNKRYVQLFQTNSMQRLISVTYLKFSNNWCIRRYRKRICKTAGNARCKYRSYCSKSCQTNASFERNW